MTPQATPTHRRLPRPIATNAAPSATSAAPGDLLFMAAKCVPSHTDCQNRYKRKAAGIAPGGLECVAQSRLVRSRSAADARSGAAHAFGDNADFFDARALGGVEHVDDVAVTQRAVAGDEHRLVL